MRHLSSLAIALLAACSAFNAQSAENSGDPCSLLEWQDFQSIGFVMDTPLIDLGWREEQTPKEIPDSKLFSSICAASNKSEGASPSVTLSIDSFMGKVTEQQVGEWLKSVASTSVQKGVEVVNVGEMTCESGPYDLPAGKDAKSAGKVVGHYTACDQQVGTKHISLNINVPEGNKGESFGPEQTRALLDKSIARMKQTAFAEPDKSI